MNWQELNKVLKQMTEEEVLTLLNEEKAGAARVTNLIRIHQRYTSLRTARERMELLAEAKSI